jgi:hypothetical protein
VAKYSISTKNYYIVLLLIASFSTWIRTGFPVYAIAQATYDDQLFIRTARYLAEGQWLGPYDSLTLAKGMFYPLFIVLAFWTSIPLKIAEQIVYLAVCALTAGLVRRQVGDNRLSIVLFALLAFNPILWTVALARVIREGLYVSLSLAVVALVVITAFPSRESSIGVSRVVLRGFGLGLVSAAFWLTREEGIWLLPAIGVVVAIALVGIMHPQWASAYESEAFARRTAQLKALALILALTLAVFAATDWLIAGLNYRYYGIFETNEIRSGSFLRAYGALSRIKHNHWRRYTPFPKDARLRAYAASPAARELANSLEGPMRDKWLWATCLYSSAKITPCDEVQAGWTMWEFREAVAASGHYRSGAEAMRFYDTLADQINSACERGTIQCLPSRSTMLPPFRREYLGETVETGKAEAKVMFTMGGGQVGSLPSVGPPQDIAIFADTVGGVYSPEKEIFVARGWTAATSAAPTVHLIAHTAVPVQSSISIMSAEDVLAVYPDLKAIRFELKTDCPVTACDLVVEVTGEGQSQIPLTQLVHGAAINTPELRLQVDSTSVGDSAILTDSRRAAQLKIAGLVASTYAKAFPLLAIFGAAGLLLATFFRRRCPIPIGLLALGLGSAAAVGSRMVLLSYLAATSFPSANPLYSSPATPFVIIFTVIGLYAWYATLKSASHSRR